MKITARSIQNLTFNDKGKTNSKSPDYRWDDTLKGFAVRIHPSGRINFWVKYRSAAGQKRLYKLGDYPALKVPAAREKAEKILARVLNGEDPQITKQEKLEEITYSELAEKYLAHFKDKKKSWHDDFQRMRDHLLPVLGKQKLSNITLQDGQTLQRKIKDKLSPATANRCMALLKHTFSIAEEWGYLESSPVKHVKLYREPQSRDIVLSPDECQRVYEACGEDENTYAGALFRIALLTGRRIGELLNAKWEDYDADNRCLVLHDTKAGERQYAYLNDTAVAVLEELSPMVGNPYIFAGGAFGKPLNGYAKPWRRIIKRAEVDYFPPHGLRHNYASMLVAAGEPLEVVGQLLGHKNSVTTRKYAHHRPDGLRKSAQRMAEVININDGKK